MRPEQYFLRLISIRTCFRRAPAGYRAQVWSNHAPLESITELLPAANRLPSQPLIQSRSHCVLWGHSHVAEERVERQLAVIRAADVVGYSRLMERDDAGTFERLRASRQEVFESEIARRRGRIVKLVGDGLLAKFGSVVDAVECAVLLQHAMAEWNGALPEPNRIEVRIGINLG